VSLNKRGIFELSSLVISTEADPGDCSV